MELADRFQKTIEEFWAVRNDQQSKNQQGKKVDAGSRGAATGGGHLRAVTALLVDAVKQVGLNQVEVHTNKAVELPGYYRSEKQWDILILSQKKLVGAIELKSQVGPSFGNNANNRSEEAIGSAEDLWKAFRQKLFGSDVRPFLGYFFLLEDCEKVHRPVTNAEPHFKVDKPFVGASYSKRYEILCERLRLEGLYDAACLTLSKNATPVTYSHPSPELSFQRFVAELQGRAVTILQSLATLP